MRAQMLRRGQIGTPESERVISLFNSSANPATWFGYHADEQMLVDARLSGLMEPESGVSHLGWMESLNPTYLPAIVAIVPSSRSISSRR